MSKVFVNAFDAHIDGFPAIDYFHPPKPQGVKQTNADLIRAMTDEELARFLSCPKELGYRTVGDCMRNNCQKCKLDWLKRENTNES